MTSTAANLKAMHPKFFDLMDAAGIKAVGIVGTSTGGTFTFADGSALELSVPNVTVIEATPSTDQHHAILKATYSAALVAACSLPTPAERRAACDAAHSTYEAACEESGFDLTDQSTTESNHDRHHLD